MICSKCKAEVFEKSTAGGQVWMANENGRRHVCGKDLARRAMIQKKVSREVEARIYWNKVYEAAHHAKQDGVLPWVAATAKAIDLLAGKELDA